MTVLGCFAAYVLIILRIAEHRMGPRLAYLYSAGPFDDFCPFSGRRRLDNGDMDAFKMSFFVGMPILYNIPAAMVMSFIGSCGSLILATITLSSLSIGWTLRMLERFVLGGSPLVPRFISKKFPSRALDLLMGALFSPTAHLHFFTGITLFFGYAWVRTLDHEARLMIK